MMAPPSREVVPPISLERRWTPWGEVLIACRPNDTCASTMSDVRCYVEQGGSVLIAATPGGHQRELTGVDVAARLPRSEWFVALSGRPEAARLDMEVPITSELCALVTLSDQVEVAATTSHAFRQRGVLAVHRMGLGRVVTSGITDLDLLLAHPMLGRYVRRLLDGAMPRRALGLAVVGYGPFGGMGHAHGLAVFETEGLAFVAAVDPVAQRREVAAAEFPGLVTYASAVELETDDRVDIVVVATPPVHHAELAVALLRAGKHVVVEKPMCLTVRDADRMMAAAESNDRTLTVHQSRRWDQDFLTLERAVASGSIGEVFNIETFVGGFEHPCRAWHSEESVSGGAVYDWGSHHIDWILRLFGETPSKVVTTSHKRVWHDVTNADQVTVAMQWPDGREATFRQSDVAAVRRPKFYVQGTAGTIEGHYRPVSFESLELGRGYVTREAHHAEAPVDLRRVRYESGAGLVEERLAQVPRPSWGFHRNLADHLLLGEPLAVPAHQGRAVVAVLEAAQAAGASGAAVIELDNAES